MIGLPPWRFRLLGYEAGFAQPGWLLLAGVVALLAVLGIWAALRRESQVTKLLGERFAAALAPGVSVFRPLVQTAFYALGLLLFVVALGQPECGSHTELVKRAGIDVVVALDVSKSMLARDVQPSRLERARLELMTLLDQLKGDRVGLVVFAGDAFIQSPLTSDYSAVKLFLRAVDPEDMPQGGSDVGGALLLSNTVLSNAERRSGDKVVVLLSDGEDFGGEVDQAIEALKAANVRVYAVGIGSESGEPIPVLNRAREVVGYKRDRQGATVLTRLDAAGLRRIAEATGGEYFHQTRGVAMAEVISRIEKLQKQEFDSRISVRYQQRFQHYALPGFALLVLGMLVRPSRRKA
jgi:Ca-activated chloride channel family protein